MYFILEALKSNVSLSVVGWLGKLQCPYRMITQYVEKVFSDKSKQNSN